MLYQVRGTTTFRLNPLSHCEGICSDLTATLQEGEIRKFPLFMHFLKALKIIFSFISVMFLNYFWEFEYYPGRGAENIAFLTETAWDNFSVY